MMDVKKLFKNKLKRLQNKSDIYSKDIKICCPVCGKEIKEDNLDGVEYVKTKRGTEIFIHNGCVGKWGDV